MKTEAETKSKTEIDRRERDMTEDRNEVRDNKINDIAHQKGKRL